MVSIRYQTREDTGRMAGLNDALAERGAFPGYGLSLASKAAGSDMGSQRCRRMMPAKCIAN